MTLGKALRRAAWLLLPVSCFPFPTFAGRPLTTEDAAILDDGTCQLEAWVDRARDATLGWLVPACNFGLGIEWQAGIAREWSEGTSRSTDTYAQAKGLFRRSTAEAPWAAGWVVGAVRDKPYALLPASVTLDDVTLHAQPGWARDREGRNLTLWGVGAEYGVHDRCDLVAEAFGENSRKPFVRAGVRWIPVKGRLELDLSYVARAGGTREERLISIGLAFR